MNESRTGHGRPRADRRRRPGTGPRAGRQRAMSAEHAPERIAARVAAALGCRVLAARRLGGGQIGRVVRCTLADGRTVVGKTSDGTPLALEAAMLRYLAEHTALPVPEVVYAADGLLVLSHVAGSSALRDAAQRDAGTHLAALHDHAADAFGFAHDTLLGPVRLDNPWTTSWPAFFAERRLRPLAERARASGSLPEELYRGVLRTADALPALLDHDPAPSLIHGDVWAGNVLADGERITAFLDPAIYFADAEVELAYIDLFDTFGAPFYSAYEARRAIDPGYPSRRPVYQLVPLLVHVELFGEGYVGALRSRLEEVGV